MTLPIYVIGSPVLRKVSKEIDENHKGLDTFINDMFETMYKSDGIGLAAPQVGRSLRLFIIDATPMEEDDPSLKDFKKVFINPTITEREGEEWLFNEGCLSIPGIREDIKRKDKIKIEYYDENFNFHEEYFTGVQGRIIQHEYDHLQGILFTDHVNPIKKRLLKSKLAAIAKGKFDASYKVKIPQK